MTPEALAGSKRHQFGDDVSGSRKRVRLEVLLDHLSLDNEQPLPKRLRSYFINPLLHSDGPNLETSNTSINGVDSLINEKLAEGYKNMLLEGLMLIKWRHPLMVVIVHFQTWVKRLFNAFVLKFNKAHSGRPPVKRFRLYSQITALVEDPRVQFTQGELLDIVAQENNLEQRVLAWKRDKHSTDKRLQEVKEGEALARECNYKYWDCMARFPQDVAMEDADEVLYEVESNYGSFYASPPPVVS